MKKFFTWLFILAFITTGVGGFLWYRQQQQAQAEGQDILRTAEIERGNLDIAVAASGNVTVNDRVDLRFTMPGTVVTLNVAATDRVTAGQILAKLDTTDLDFAIRQSEIALEQIKLNLDSLNQPPDAADVALAELAIQDAAQALAVARLNKESTTAQNAQNIRVAQQAADSMKDAYDDYQQTAEKYSLPVAYGAGMNAAYLETTGYAGIAYVKADQQYEQAQSQWLAAYLAYEQAQNSLAQLQAGVDPDQIRQLELQIEQAHLNLDQTRESLDDISLTAPFDGIVSAVNIQVDNPTSNALPALTILDDSTLFINVTVDEIDIANIVMDQSVRITLDAYPNAELTGVVENIGALPQDFGGIIAYPLRIRLTDRGDVDVRDGMTANVTIHTERIEDVLLIPNWAIRTDQSTSTTYVYCYCLEANTPVRQDITTGRRNDTHTEVHSGLQAGATVALVTEERNLFDIISEGPPR